MSTTKRLYLIDGYSNIFRAFYAIRELSNSRGEPTNAVFGFLQMLRKLLRDETPAYIGVALDVSKRTVRSERFAEYKANRAPMPDELRPQIPWIRKVIEAYRIPILELPSYEADDVLGTLAAKATAAGFEVVLLSPDKDLMQLVGGGTSLYHTRREKQYDAALVEEDFGVPPAQVADVLALMGDTSDNVPGVPGIGKVGATKLIRAFGSVEALLERTTEVKAKRQRENLTTFRDQALLSKELVTIHTDLPIPFEPENLQHEEPDYPQLIEICRELEFTSLLKELEASHAPPAEPVPAATAVTSPEAWQQRTAALTSPLHLAAVGEGEALGLAVAGSGDEIGDEKASDEEESGGVLYADFRHPGLRDAVLASLATWAADEACTLIGHDLKEVLRLLGAASVVRCRLLDTMLVSYLLSPARSHGLEEVVQGHLHHQALGAKEAGWSKGEVPEPESEGLLTYAAERVELPRRLAAVMSEELQTSGLEKVYDRCEAPLVPVLARMEETGVRLDVDFLAAMSTELATELAALEEEIYTLADERFNIHSPSQLGTILFEKLNYPVVRRTRKTRSYSTDAETLEILAARGFPLPERLIRFRELSKLKSTYIDALPALVAADGRLHTRFNQAVAATGRLSSAHPNLQNIPIRTPVGHRIRKAFRAADGHRLVVADYSQIELRVLAHIAEEEAMISAFQAGKDIHAATAAAVFGIIPELVNGEQRRMAKVINFGIIYGMSSFGLARQLGITKKDAEAFIAAYMERYPGVERYTEETVAAARESGRVETLYGRIRWLPEIRSRNFNRRENAKRMAINARIQGTAADLLKLAMIAVDERLRSVRSQARLLLTVHDELVLAAPSAEAGAVAALVCEEMEGVATLRVPLVVEAGVGADWYAAKEG